MALRLFDVAAHLPWWLTASTLKPYGLPRLAQTDAEFFREALLRAGLAPPCLRVLTGCFSFITIRAIKAS